MQRMIGTLKTFAHGTVEVLNMFKVVTVAFFIGLGLVIFILGMSVLVKLNGSFGRTLHLARKGV